MKSRRETQAREGPCFYKGLLGRALSTSVQLKVFWNIVRHGTPLATLAAAALSFVGAEICKPPVQFLLVPPLWVG